MMLTKSEVEKLKELPWYTFEVTYCLEKKTLTRRIRGKRSFTWELENCVRFTIVGDEGESLFELDGELFISCRVLSQTTRQPRQKATHDASPQVLSIVHR
jgi:hypothetical protein